MTTTKIEEFHSEPEFSELSSTLTRIFGDGELSDLGFGMYTFETDTRIMNLSLDRLDIGTTEVYYVWNLMRG